MRRLLIFSLFLNSVLAGCIGFMVLRLGGWKYTFYRFWHDESGLYQHRKSLFVSCPARQGAVVFLGDSQVEQCEWEEVVGGSTNRQTWVLNRGIVGDQVDGVLARLPEVLRHQPSKVFLCVGVNDLLLDKSYTDIELKYRSIVRKIRTDNRNGQLVLISILPVNNTVKRIGVSNEQIAEVNNRLQQVARDFAVPYVDLNSHLLDANGNLSQRFTEDGIHLNGQGYGVWKEAIAQYLQ